MQSGFGFNLTNTQTDIFAATYQTKDILIADTILSWFRFYKQRQGLALAAWKKNKSEHSHMYSCARVLLGRHQMYFTFIYI